MRILNCQYYFPRNSGIGNLLFQFSFVTVQGKSCSTYGDIMGRMQAPGTLCCVLSYITDCCCLINLPFPIFLIVINVDYICHIGDVHLGRVVRPSTKFQSNYREC